MTQQATALAVDKPLTPQQLLKRDLENAETQLAAVLPKHVTVKRMIKVVLSATARNPDLLKCSRASILLAVMQGCELGLEIGGLTGEAYLVPYKTECKCMPGYKGLIKLAKQSGLVRSVGAFVVYEKDEFVPDLADESRFKHVMYTGGDRGQMIAVWSQVRYKDGTRSIDVMTKSDVEKIRQRSKTGGGGPWVTDFAEMAKKTVVRRHLKYEDLSVELKAALELDTEVEEYAGTVTQSATSAAALTAELLADEPKDEKPEELKGEVTPNVD